MKNNDSNEFFAGGDDSFLKFHNFFTSLYSAIKSVDLLANSLNLSLD